MITVKCARCYKLKLSTDFYKDKRAGNGLMSACKDCHNEQLRAAYAENPKKFKDKVKQYKENNIEKRCETEANWRARNEEKIKRYMSEWRQNNRESTRLYSQNHVFVKKGAVIDYGDNMEIIELVCAEAVYRGLEIDHIVPVEGENVCGLHVYWNMQLLTKEQNSAKGNRLWA